MSKPMFIDLTVVCPDGEQRYAVQNIASIDAIDIIENRIYMPGKEMEITEESMMKLLDTIENKGLLVGQDYKLPDDYTSKEDK